MILLFQNLQGQGMNLATYNQLVKPYVDKMNNDTNKQQLSKTEFENNETGVRVLRSQFTQSLEEKKAAYYDEAAVQDILKWLNENQKGKTGKSKEEEQKEFKVYAEEYSYLAYDKTVDFLKLRLKGNLIEGYFKQDQATLQKRIISEGSALLNKDLAAFDEVMDLLDEHFKTKQSIAVTDIPKLKKPQTKVRP